jgi:hypothetical protein
MTESKDLASLEANEKKADALAQQSSVMTKNKCRATENGSRFAK